MRKLWLLVVVCALSLACQDGAKKDEAKKDEKVEKKAEEKIEKESATATATAPEEPVAEEQVLEAKREVLDARKVLEEVAKWLPAKTILFLFADLGAIDPNELGMGLFTIPASFDPGPMTEELGAFLEKRIGLNLTKVEWVAAAGAPDPDFFVLFLGGDFGELAGTEDLPSGLKIRALEGESAFLATIPGAKGLAVLPDKTSVELLSSVLLGEIPTLPGTSGLALFDTLLERAGPTRGFIAVAQLTDVELREKLTKKLFSSLKGFVSPDGALIAGGEDLLFLIHGPEASLEMIEGQLTLMKAMAKAMLDQGMAGIDKVPVPQGVGLIAAKHMWPILAEQLTPKREGEYMWLDLQVPGGLGMVSVVGVLASVAIPAFIKYMRRAKASEAALVLDKFYKAAAMYYVAQRVSPDGTAVTCALPPVAGPVPRAGTCCGSLGGADGDGADRCDGDEDEWNAAFGALGVPYPGPHFFTYEILKNPTSPESAMIVRATGDLDCDGIRSTFERYLVGRPVPGGGCELEDGHGMYSEDETE
ncbi:MAG: hypothetical protein ABIK09_01250 [Pseudomonadota bacterium]